MAFALLSRSRSKTQGSVKPVAKRKSARAQHPADARFGSAKPVFQPHTAALPMVPMLQAKLKVGEPDDKFEEEADRVAELRGNDNGSIPPSAEAQSRSPMGSLQHLYGNQPVLQTRHGSGDLPAPSVPLRPSQGGILQRKCACGGAAGMSGECEECSNKQRFGLQTKLKINEPGDIYEQEADRIADQVIAAPAHPAVSGAPPRIQRFSGQSNGQIGAAPASVDQALSSPGRPLEPALRQDMEQRFGYDFSQVRVHSGPAAEQSAREVNAHAYTVGHNILFGMGQFAPGTQAGRRLIAHELTHVVQQSGRDVMSVGQSNDQRGLAPISRVFSDGRYQTSSHEGKKLIAQELTHAVQQTDSTPLLQRQPDRDDDPVMSRRDEIALSKLSPGEFEIGSGFPPTISLFNFTINDHELKNEHKVALRILGELFGLMDTTQWQALAVGHADSTGEPAVNDPLSARRADEVRKYLNDVTKGNYFIQGEGEDRPVVTNESVSGRTRNRRVDIVFINPNIDINIPDPVPDPKTVCQLFPFLCNEDEFCDRYPSLCGEGFCAENPKWCVPPVLCLLFPPACACLVHPIACACGMHPALCACLANPLACLKGRESKDEPEPKRQRACPIKVDLPSGVIEASKSEEIGFAELWYPFEMNIDFSQDSSGCECACGEYTQLVRGYFETDKTGKGPWKTYEHELTKGVYLHETTFQEDAVVGLGGPFDAYGHRYWDDEMRKQPKSNVENDKFLLTRETGCQYRGKDKPFLESPKKHRARIRMYLEFAGGPADVCESPGQRLGQQTHWRTWIIHGEAQAKTPPPGPITPPTNSPNTTAPVVTEAEETDIGQEKPSPSWYAGGIPSDATSGEYQMIVGFKVNGVSKFSLVPVTIEASQPTFISVVTVNKRNLNLNPDDPKNPIIVTPHHREQIERSVLLRVEKGLAAEF